MATFEYKTTCAPRKAQKIKGVKSGDDRYAQTLTDVINEQAEDGWEYFRAESLPIEEKAGFFGKTTEKYLSVLIFRRENIETYEEPTFEPETQPEPILAIQSLSIDDEEPSGDIASLGPATRD